ncbi:tetraspanin-8-like [Brachionichthys hirsutus]|uniref:tetraspanin-8-like n=1 Tax=Brachionichthys hirsutus TaxID=412623 RepID=UPI003605358C
MSQVNACLKRTFIIFNILFAIIGAAILILALVSQVFTNVNGGENLEGRTAGLIALYVVGSVTVVIAVLGAYGAHRESKVCLILFLVCMIFGCVMTLRTGIPAAIARAELPDMLESQFRKLLPLDRAQPAEKRMAENLQTQLHCCGLFSYEDWEENIPDSCVCSEEAELEGKCQTVSYEVLMLARTSVYTKTCFPIILHFVALVTDVMIGVVFTLAALALLGMVLSTAIIVMMRYPNVRAIVLPVPTIFTTPPPKYQELHNPPHY